MDDVKVLRAVRDMLEYRVPRVTAALREPEFAPHLQTQAYLDGGTAERAYYHAGYAAGLRMVLRMIQDGVEEYGPNADQT